MTMSFSSTVMVMTDRWIAGLVTIPSRSLIDSREGVSFRVEIFEVPTLGAAIQSGDGN
jgi:hypothetical protein